jgi:hypothetical protein
MKLTHLTAEAIALVSDVASALDASGLAPGSLDYVRRPVAGDAFLALLQQQESKTAIPA